jgi:hypothetical protein
MTVALCMQQSQGAGARNVGKGSRKGSGGSQRSFGSKGKAKKKPSGQRGGRSTGSTGRMPSHGGRKGTGAVRPMTGMNRF